MGYRRWLLDQLGFKLLKLIVSLGGYSVDETVHNNSCVCCPLPQSRLNAVYIDYFFGAFYRYLHDVISTFLLPIMFMGYRRCPHFARQ
jgi:hypothetical protein